MRIMVLLPLALALGGCIAQTAVDIATLPVKVASSAVDAVTTTQSEKDEKRGREIRKQDECLGREERKADRERREPDYAKCDSNREPASGEDRARRRD